MTNPWRNKHRPKQKHLNTCWGIHRKENSWNDYEHEPGVTVRGTSQKHHCNSKLECTDLTVPLPMEQISDALSNCNTCEEGTWRSNKTKTGSCSPAAMRSYMKNLPQKQAFSGAVPATFPGIGNMQGTSTDDSSRTRNDQEQGVWPATLLRYRHRKRSGPTDPAQEQTHDEEQLWRSALVPGRGTQRIDPNNPPQEQGGEHERLILATLLGTRMRNVKNWSWQPSLWTGQGT